jgi:hypothetical protein
MKALLSVFSFYLDGDWQKSALDATEAGRDYEVKLIAHSKIEKLPMR